MATAPAQATTVRAPGTIVPTMDGPEAMAVTTAPETKAATINSARGVPAGTDVPTKGGRQ